jgi:hypothetical protein
MWPVLIARSNDAGVQYIRIVHPDYIIHEVSCPTVSLRHYMRHNYRLNLLVAAVDLPGYLIHTTDTLMNTFGQVPLLRDALKYLMVGCYSKCRHVGPRWTIVTGDGVDELLHKLCDAINNELFFV